MTRSLTPTRTLRFLTLGLASIAMLACAPMEGESEDDEDIALMPPSATYDEEEDDEEAFPLDSQTQALSNVYRCGRTCLTGEHVTSTSCVDLPGCRLSDQSSCLYSFNSVMCSTNTDDYWTCNNSCPSGYLLSEVSSVPSVNCRQLDPNDGRRRRCVRDTTRPAQKFVLRHAGGMCIHPKGGASRPAKKTPAVLYPLCTQEARLQFEHKAWKSITHVSSALCLQAEDGSANPAVGTRVVYSDRCGAASISTNAGFEFTSNGSLRHIKSGLCVHPRGGSANPGSETELVLWNSCDEPRLRFTAVGP